MKLIKQVYHFLGGVFFALILIASVALFVIAGTFLESFSQSHLYAARFTYDSPIFALLLWGFFINILFAATRRWPFKVRHIPFLITHLGLLMILGGVLVKHYAGLQGTLLLVEGSGSHGVQEANTFALRVEKKGDTSPAYYPIGGLIRRDDGLVLRLAEFNAHSSEQFATWVKGSVAVLGGLNPMPLSSEISVGGRVRFDEDQVWDLYALRASNLEDTLEKLSAKNIKRPLLAIIETADGDVYLAGIGPYGDRWTKHFKKNVFDTLLAYDDGFGGYAITADLPFETLNMSSQKKENIVAKNLEKGLRHAVEAGTALVLPLEIFKRACIKVNADFPESLANFLIYWNKKNSWLYPQESLLPENLKKIFQELSWEGVPSHVPTGCSWMVTLFEKIGPALDSGRPPLDVLRDAQWPLLSILMTDEDPDILTLLSQQVFAAAEQQGSVTFTEEPTTPERQAALLSAQLRLYGIHFSTLADQSIDDTEGKSVTLETSVAAIHQPLPPGQKIEENIPRIVLHTSKGEVAKAVSLSYDRTGKGLKWPVLNGEYLLRFQPNVVDIPYHLRLRQARQINYANSSQAYSYESDLIITDRRSGAVVEKTISMNNVHETWDGYRFYLSSIAPPDASSVKQIQVVVNRDPAKYWLTYPGAIILSCGILLLFTRRKKHE